MIPEEKIKRARKKLRGGEPEGEIRNNLRKEGYSEEEIDKIFVPHKPDMRGWYLWSSIIFFIGGIWFFSLLLIVAAAIMFSLYYAEQQKKDKA